jgi:hypothetical protein
MAVSYECERCNNSRTAQPSAGSVSSKRRALRETTILGAKAKGAWRIANFALECESELDKRGAAPHVSSDQETWRPKVIPKQRPAKPLLPLHRQQHISAADAQALGSCSIIIDCRQWIHMSRLRGRSLIEFGSDSRFV